MVEALLEHHFPVMRGDDVIGEEGNRVWLGSRKRKGKRGRGSVARRGEG